MLARLAFALSINVDAEVLMFDEVLAVGDLVFRERCIQKIQELREQKKQFSTSLTTTRASPNAV